MSNKTEAQIKFLLDDATQYVEKLEKDLTQPAAQNAYHALCRLYNEQTNNETEQKTSELIKHYETACEEVNKRFPT